MYMGKIGGTSGCLFYVLFVLIDLIKMIYFITNGDIPFGLTAGGYVFLNIAIILVVGFFCLLSAISK